MQIAPDDSTPPVLTLPGTISVNATGPEGALVSRWSPSVVAKMLLVGRVVD